MNRKTLRIISLSITLGIGGVAATSCGGDAISPDATAVRFPDIMRRTCATVEPSQSKMASIELELADAVPERAGGNITIPVYVHVITNGTAGAVSDAAIAN